MVIKASASAEIRTLIEALAAGTMTWRGRRPWRDWRSSDRVRWIVWPLRRRHDGSGDARRHPAGARADRRSAQRVVARKAITEGGDVAVAGAGCCGRC
jgi:hypothetical protein